VGHLTVDGRIVGRRGRWNHREKREEKEKGSRVDGEWLSFYTGSQSTRRQGRSPHATVGSPSGMEANSSSVGPSNSRSNNSSESEGMRRKRQTAASICRGGRCSPDGERMEDRPKEEEEGKKEGNLECKREGIRCGRARYLDTRKHAQE
jgi:hypothetical protein